MKMIQFLLAVCYFLFSFTVSVIGAEIEEYYIPMVQNYGDLLVENDKGSITLNFNHDEDTQGKVIISKEITSSDATSATLSQVSIKKSVKDRNFYLYSDSPNGVSVHIELQLPRALHLDSTRLSLGKGEIKFDRFHNETLYISLGKGRIMGDHLSCQKCTIKIGKGKTYLKEVDVGKSLFSKVGKGKICFGGIKLDETAINGHVGAGSFQIGQKKQSGFGVRLEHYPSSYKAQIKINLGKGSLMINNETCL